MNPKLKLTENSIPILSENPLVSIVIDNYNYSSYLKEAIDSALNQSYKNFEIIVVDDGSTDNSQQIIASYKEKVQGVYKENGGQASAFNIGLSKAKGEIVCLLDSDDYFHPDKVSNVVNGFKKHPSWIQIVDPWYTVNRCREIVRKPYPRGFSTGDVRDLLLDIGHYKNAAAGSALSYRSKVLEYILPIPEYMKRGADAYLVTAAAFYGQVGFISHASTYYRVHGSNGFTGNKNLEYRLQKRLIQVKQTNHLAEITGVEKKYSLDKDADYLVLKLVESSSDISWNYKLKTFYRILKKYVFLFRSIKDTMPGFLSSTIITFYPSFADSVFRLGVKRSLISIFNSVLNIKKDQISS